MPRVVVLYLCVLCTAQAPAHAEPGGGPDADRRVELVNLLRQDCGACHGLHLTGGLGPALDARTLRHRSVEEIAQVILRGRPGTAMPPWEFLLTSGDAQWIAEQLLKGRVDGN